MKQGAEAPAFAPCLYDLNTDLVLDCYTREEYGSMSGSFAGYEAEWDSEDFGEVVIGGDKQGPEGTHITVWEDDGGFGGDSL